MKTTTLQVEQNKELTNPYNRKTFTTLRDVSQAENKIVDAGYGDNFHNLEIRRQESEFSPLTPSLSPRGEGELVTPNIQ